MKKKKRYWCSVIEEFWPGQKEGWHIGRIEVYDNRVDSPYTIYEARFALTDELYCGFRKLFDWKRFNELPYIVFNYSKYETYSKDKEVSNEKE